MTERKGREVEKLLQFETHWKKQLQIGRMGKWDEEREDISLQIGLTITQNLVNPHYRHFKFANSADYGNSLHFELTSFFSRDFLAVFCNLLGPFPA